MYISIDASDPRPIYRQIVDEVQRALVLGNLQPGDPLPSVRELAADLRVNPKTVSEAYKELERDGVVYVQRGQGTFIDEGARPPSARRVDLARDVAERALLEAHRHGVGVDELVEALRAISEREPAAESDDRITAEIE